MAEVYKFDPQAIRVKDAREYRKLTGVPFWTSMQMLKNRGIEAVTEDEILGIAYLVRKQGSEDPDSFTMAEMDNWSFGQCMELMAALKSALDDENPSEGSPTSS